MDSKYSMCMAKNGNENKHTRHIARRIRFVINKEKCNMHKIDCCGGGMQFSDISTNNVSENDLTPIMRYIMVIIDNWDRTLAQEGWYSTG